MLIVTYEGEHNHPRLPSQAANAWLSIPPFFKAAEKEKEKKERTQQDCSSPLQINDSETFLAVAWIDPVHIFALFKLGGT